VAASTRRNVSTEHLSLRLRPEAPDGALSSSSTSSRLTTELYMSATHTTTDLADGEEGFWSVASAEG